MLCALGDMQDSATWDRRWRQSAPAVAWADSVVLGVIFPEYFSKTNTTTQKNNHQANLKSGKMYSIHNIWTEYKLYFNIQYVWNNIKSNVELILKKKKNTSSIIAYLKKMIWIYITVCEKKTQNISITNKLPKMIFRGK